MNTRRLIFDYNLSRAKQLADHCNSLPKERLSDDIGMFSVVAAVGSLDEFVKASTFDIVFMYLTQQWTPSHDINLNQISKNDPTSLINATIRIIDKLLSGQQAYTPQNLNEIKDLVHIATNKLNYQGYQNIKKIMEELSGNKISNLPGTQNSVYSGIINRLTDKRHEYVHRVGIDPMRIGQSTYTAPVTQGEIDGLKTFSQELILLFS